MPIKIVSCKRLGRLLNNSKPRKLLVQLQSEAEARNVLDYAKTLRISTNEFIAKNVFVNADLSKEEALEAFTRRQRRRLERNQGIGGHHASQASPPQQPSYSWLAPQVTSLTNTSDRMGGTSTSTTSNTLRVTALAYRPEAVSTVSMVDQSVQEIRSSSMSVYPNAFPQQTECLDDCGSHDNVTLDTVGGVMANVDISVINYITPISNENCISPLINGCTPVQAIESDLGLVNAA